MHNDPSSLPATSSPGPHDPRVHALQTAFARARLDGASVVPPTVAQAVLEDIRERLLGGRPSATLDGHPPSTTIAVGLENMEAEALALLLAADLLDHDTLHAVHGAFADARASLAAHESRSSGQTLQQALHARDRQLSIATHELRTPISSILLNLQMLERTARLKGPLDAEAVTRLLAVPSRQLRRLTRMVDLLLDSAQVENERLVLDRQPADLCELVHEAAARLAERADGAGCKLSLQGCKPVHGRWDRLRLDQVITNLLTNAIKYGGGQVEVDTCREREAVLRVRDHGPGIPDEDRDRIFEPFERLPSAGSEDGAGLGLYIVREIVRAHGGRIEVENAPGGGAMFSVHLPI
ncbi:MAG TPA: HAMP domain-containing sensor histidine kinase [Ramlibacter sp.]|jgi:signal transduction histidine kinase|nr:HAMP domain-containing sensor histidine kinase [Ramlibacter sp.]